MLNNQTDQENDNFLSKLIYRHDKTKTRKIQIAASPQRVTENHLDELPQM
jgi:hypothetical protein